MIYDIYKLRDIAEIEFSDIISTVIIKDINEINMILYEDSFINLWFSLKIKDKYSYHWDRSKINGSIYRHDNAAHKKWKDIKTFPKHFHDTSEYNVIESNISQDMYIGLREFLYFVRDTLKKNN
jgi:hypothetical protein